MPHKDRQLFITIAERNYEGHLIRDFHILFFNTEDSPITVEPGFNEVPRDWANWFVISRVRYIENLVITNCWKTTKVFVISGYC